MVWVLLRKWCLFSLIVVSVLWIEGNVVLFIFSRLMFLVFIRCICIVDGLFECIVLVR